VFSEFCDISTLISSLSVTELVGVGRKVPGLNPVLVTDTLIEDYSSFSQSVQANVDIRRPSAKLVDSPYYSESELCGGAVTVSF